MGQFLTGEFGQKYSGVDTKEIVAKTGVYQVHSSCKNYRTDPTTIRYKVNYSYLPHPHTMDYDVVDVKLVKKLVDSLYEP